MVDYDYIVQDLGEMIDENNDEYGQYVEFEVTLSPEYRTRAYEQLDSQLNGASDTYIDFYLRRYEDQSTKIFLAVNEDFIIDGQFIEEEFELDENEIYDLDQLDIDSYNF